MIILFYLISIFEYQEPGGSSSTLLLSSIGNTSYIATNSNSAILAKLNKNGVGVVYCQPYNIGFLQYTRLSANYRNFGFSVSRLGQTGYQEYKFNISAGVNFNPNLSYGLILKGLYLDLGDYGQSFIPALNVGLLLKTDKFDFGAVLDNINNPQDPVGENIPWSISFGTIFRPVSDFSIGLDLQKNALEENIAVGTELNLTPSFAIRLGSETNPFIICGGLGFIFKNICFDYTLKYHTRLKETSIFSIGYFL